MSSKFLHRLSNSRSNRILQVIPDNKMPRGCTSPYPCSCSIRTVEEEFCRHKDTVTKLDGIWLGVGRFWDDIKLQAAGLEGGEGEDEDEEEEAKEGAKGPLQAVEVGATPAADVVRQRGHRGVGLQQAVFCYPSLDRERREEGKGK